MALKQDIIQVAAARMNQVGIRSVSVDDICHELGISKKTFYVHFNSKDALIEALLHINEEKLQSNLNAMVKRKTVVQAMKDWMAIAKTANQSDDETRPMMYDLKKYYPDVVEKHEKAIRTILQQFLVVFLQKGIDEHIFRAEIDVELSAMLFIDVHKSLIYKANKLRLTKERLHQIGKHSMDILLRGVLTPEGFATLEKEVNK